MCQLVTSCPNQCLCPVGISCVPQELNIQSWAVGCRCNCFMSLWCNSSGTVQCNSATWIVICCTANYAPYCTRASFHRFLYYSECDTLVTGWLMCALERGMPAGDPDCYDSLKWIGMDWIWIGWPSLRRESSITWQSWYSCHSDWDCSIENGLNLDCWLTGDIAHVRTQVDIWCFNFGNILTLCIDNWWEFPPGLPRSPGATTPSVVGIRSSAAFPPPQPTLHLSLSNSTHLNIHSHPTLPISVTTLTYVTLKCTF